MFIATRVLTFAAVSGLIILATSLTSVPSLGPNPTYSSAGTYIFNTGSAFGSNTSLVLPFTITFTRAHTTSTYAFGYSIKQINYAITSNKVNYTVESGTKTATSVAMKFYTSNANKISSLSIAYVIIEPLFGLYDFVICWIKPSSNINDGQYFQQTVSGVGPYTSTNQSIWTTIVGADVSLSSNNQYDLYATASLLTTSSILFKISTISPTQFYLTSVIIEAFVYNATLLQGSPRSARFSNAEVNSLNSYTNSAMQSYNTIYGVRTYHPYNQNFLIYQWTLSSSTLTVTSSNTFSWVGFNYLILQFITCSPTTPYLLISNNICYDIVPPRYYADGYNQCQPCPYDCYACLSNGSCTSCSNSSDFRMLNTSTSRCIPISGYYESGVTVALPCNSSACLTCSSLTFCLSCSSATYLSASNTCLPCISNCLNCTASTNCQLCSTNRVFTNMSCIVDCSSITNCSTCSLSNETVVCLSCTYGYNVTNNTCKQLCGNGLKTQGELCDDGNTVNGDGCSSTCAVQLGFYCVYSNTSYPASTCTHCSSNCTNCINSTVCTNCTVGYQIVNATCLNTTSNTTNSTNSTNSTNATSPSNATNACLNGTLTIKLASAIKDPFSNTLTLTYSISPVQSFLCLTNNSYDVLPYLSLAHPNASCLSAVYNPADSNIYVVISYNQSLQGEKLGLIFNPPAVPASAVQQTSSSQWMVRTTNHLSASYYPPSTYQRVQKLQVYCSVVVGLYLLLSLLAIFFRKFIGLELASLIQMGYLSLVIDDQLSAYLYPVSALKYVFGYNQFYLGGQAATTSSSYSLFGYKIYFGFACNAMLLAILSAYCLSLLLFCLSTASSKSVSRKLAAAAHKLLNEVGFTLVIFSAPNMFTALFIQIQEKTLLDASIFWSKAFLCLAGAALVGSFLLALFNAEESSEIGTFFRKHNWVSVYTSIFFSLRLYIFTALIFIGQLSNVISFILISLQVLYLLFVLFGRPHKKLVDYIRAAIIEFSLLYILIVRYLEAQVLNNKASQEGMLYEVLSMVELAAYGLAVLVSIVSLLYHFAKKSKKNKVEPSGSLLEDVWDKIKNDSIAKLDEFYKGSLEQSRASKRRINQPNSDIVFNFDQMEAETHQVQGNTATSSIKLDIKRLEKKYRKKR